MDHMTLNNAPVSLTPHLSNYRPTAHLLPRWRGWQDRGALQTSPGLVGVLKVLPGRTHLAKVCSFGPLRWSLRGDIPRLRPLVCRAIWRGNCMKTCCYSYSERWHGNPLVTVINCSWTKSVMDTSSALFIYGSARLVFPLAYWLGQHGQREERQLQLVSLRM